MKKEPFLYDVEKCGYFYFLVHDHFFAKKAILCQWKIIYFGMGQCVDMIWVVLAEKIFPPIHSNEEILEKVSSKRR